MQSVFDELEKEDWQKDKDKKELFKNIPEERRGMLALCLSVNACVLTMTRLKEDELAGKFIFYSGKYLIYSFEDDEIYKGMEKDNTERVCGFSGLVRRFTPEKFLKAFATLVLVSKVMVDKHKEFEGEREKYLYYLTILFSIEAVKTAEAEGINPKDFDDKK